MSIAPPDSALHLDDCRPLLEGVAGGGSPESWWLAQGRGCLVLKDGGAGLASSDQDALASWLRQLPCPVIALAPDSGVDPVLSACDARTESPTEAGSMTRNITRSPCAALTLVQVLRVAEHLPVERALVVESLAYAALQDGPEFRRWRDSYSPPSQIIPDVDPAVLIERDDAHLSVRLNRPHAHNALNVAMRDALVEAFDLASADDTISAVTVSGAGRCYSVGGDLVEFGDRPDAATAHRIRSQRSPALSLQRCAGRVEFRLHNACIGSGIELPAFGRRLVAQRSAFFQLPELHLGLIPGSGGCVSLPKRIGRQRTALLALTGRRLSARRALEWGLVDELID